MLRIVKEGARYFKIAYISSMAMTKKAVGVIVILITLSLAGLVILQVYLLGSSLTLKEQTFRRDVLNTLSAVTEALEAQETVKTAYEIGGKTADGKNITVITRMDRDLEGDSPGFEDVLRCADTMAPYVQSTDSGIMYCVPSPQHIILQVLDSTGVLDTTLVDHFSGAGIFRVGACDGRLDSGPYSVRLLTDSSVQVFAMTDLDSLPAAGMVAGDSGKTGFAMKVLKRLWDIEERPIQERLDAAVLDSVIKDHMTEAGFELDYVYGVAGSGVDSLIYGPFEYADELLETEYKTRLYPHDMLAQRFDLLMYFPAGKVYLWRQLSPMLLSTVAFIFIIIYCFVYVIRTLMAQKRSSALMVDFVNNMTHEFKTPISSVALACEAILRSDVISDHQKVTQYAKLIHDENQRMRRQTEKILQMAALEEGDLELKLTEVDLHRVITEAVENIAIQIESREGKISCSLDATHSLVGADKVHLSNIIFNLLDNANKYSPEKPSISVSTWNGNHGIHVRIEDSGKGIGEEHIKHIFKKYYRVPTGNIHDVKGFGLGLSYVKLITEAHGGHISLNSTLGRGTQVDLFFPIVKETGSEAADGG